MIKVDMRSNMRDVIRDVERLAKQDAPFVIAAALTATAKAVQAAEVAEIRRVFDRPTSWATNGTYVKPATKDKLAAFVKLKDEPNKGATPAVNFLGAHVEGGKRRHKRFELALIAYGIMPPDMYAVPGERAQLDSYGNVARGQMMKILSALGTAERTSGYSANRTAGSRKRRGRMAEYVLAAPGRSKRLGIWQYLGGRALRPVLIFVRQPAYKVRFAFYDVAERVTVERFPRELTAQLDRVLARGAR